MLILIKQSSILFFWSLAGLKCFTHQLFAGTHPTGSYQRYSDSLWFRYARIPQTRSCCHSSLNLRMRGLSSFARLIWYMRNLSCQRGFHHLNTKLLLVCPCRNACEAFQRHGAHVGTGIAFRSDRTCLSRRRDSSESWKYRVVSICLQLVDRQPAFHLHHERKDKHRQIYKLRYLSNSCRYRVCTFCR